MTWRPIDTGDPAANRLINVASALADPSPPVWWWLSFCDTSKPAGQQFLGVAIVKAANHGAAVSAAWANDCNPGGQVMIIGPLDEKNMPDSEFRNRLLTKAEAVALVPTVIP